MKARQKTISSLSDTNPNIFRILEIHDILFGSINLIGLEYKSIGYFIATLPKIFL